MAPFAGQAAKHLGVLLYLGPDPLRESGDPFLRAQASPKLLLRDQACQGAGHHGEPLAPALVPAARSHEPAPQFGHLVLGRPDLAPGRHEQGERVAVRHVQDHRHDLLTGPPGQAAKADAAVGEISGGKRM